MPLSWLNEVAPDLPQERPALDAWLDHAFTQARATKRAAGREWWAKLDAMQRHELVPVLHADPYQRRAFDKPRGYAGDAVMLDLIYDGLADDADVSPFGRALFEAYQARTTCEAIRERRRELARRLEAVAQRGDGRVLAVACGHLREADLVSPGAWAGITDLVAFDQDRDSLAAVDQRYGGLPVRTLPGRIQHLIRGEGPDGPFDLVYAAGLYDYLDAPTATALTAHLARKLDIGGCLLIGNMDESAEMPFADVVQAWTLVTRTPAEMAKLSAGLRELEEEFSEKVWTDEWGAIVWLEITRTK